MKQLLAILIVFLTACSTLPEAINTAPADDLQLWQVLKGDNDFIGQQVRWGGKIVSVRQENNFSIIEVQHYPLNNYGFPLTLQASQGYFIAQTGEDFDPDIYQQGLFITFAGTINSGETKTINREEHYLPIVNISETRLWPYRTDRKGRSTTNTGAESRYHGYGIYGSGTI